MVSIAKEEKKQAFFEVKENCLANSSIYFKDFRKQKKYYGRELKSFFFVSSSSLE